MSVVCVRFRGVALALLVGGVLSVSAGAEEPKQLSSAQLEMKMMDADHDGKITAAEHAAGSKKMFEKMDGNHDGRVTAVEMDAGQKAMKGQDATQRSMASTTKIKTVDINEDGILTDEEHAAASQRMFEKMDADRDGKVTAAELDAGHEDAMSNARE